jgi:hypothetical protein
MIRRHQRTGELAFYRCFMPYPVPLAMLVRVAGTRWAVEERFQAGKGLVGLDQHQVRRWPGWYRWVTLAMLASAFLVVAALAERTHHPAPAGLIGPTCNEAQHLFAAPIVDAGHRSLTPATGCAGRCGDDDIRHAPAPATTDDRPPDNHEHHDLRWTTSAPGD